MPEMVMWEFVNVYSSSNGSINIVEFMDTVRMSAQLEYLY